MSQHFLGKLLPRKARARLQIELVQTICPHAPPCRDGQHVAAVEIQRPQPPQ